MALSAYRDLDHLASRAAAKALTPVSKRFYLTLGQAFVREGAVGPNPGDKQSIVRSIAAAVAELLATVAEATGARRCPAIIPTPPDMGRPKQADYALTTASRIYLIEQKTILEANQYGAVFYEAYLAKTFSDRKVRFVGLFHHTKKPVKHFDRVRGPEGILPIVDELFVLNSGIGDAYWDGYQTGEVDRLYGDAVTWLKSEALE